MFEEGEPIILNRNTTTFQMVIQLSRRSRQVFPNRFPKAKHIFHNSRNTVLFLQRRCREQNIIITPIDDDVWSYFHIRRMFMGAQGLAPLRPMEGGPLPMQAEQKRREQLNELVVLADVFMLCACSSPMPHQLAPIRSVITDDGMSGHQAQLLEAANIRLTTNNAATGRLRRLGAEDWIACASRPRALWRTAAHGGSRGLNHQETSIPVRRGKSMTISRKTFRNGLTNATLAASLMI